MASRKRKKAVRKIKFQLTRSGLAGVAVVCFCIFLWMFLIGVWVGQAFLYPPTNVVRLSPVQQGAKGIRPSSPGVLQIGAQHTKKKMNGY